MLVALLSLLIILLVVRGIAFAVRAFFAWLGKGKEIRWLVDGNYVDTEHAEELRAAIERFERDAARERLEQRIEGKAGRLTRRQLRAIGEAHQRARNAYLDELALNWYQIVIIFLVGSFLGLILEEIWMYITAGLTESRVGLVWGPYSPIYGFGAVLLTLLCWKLRQKGASKLVIFLLAALVGGLLEQLTGWAMETFLGAVSWDYTGVPGAITKWVALPFLFFWGALGLIWAEHIMPELLFRIGMPTTVRQATFVFLLAIYLALDIFMTVSCFGRMAARDAGIPPSNGFEAWIDENYTDQFIATRFQNMAIDGLRS